MKINFKYLIFFILFLLIEIIIAKYINDSFVRPYMGDVLVVILIYCFVQIFQQKKLKWLPAYIFVFAVVVEILQLVNVLSILGLKGNRLARIVFGTNFDFKDIICYFIGTLILFAWQYIDRGNYIEKN